MRLDFFNAGESNFMKRLFTLFALILYAVPALGQAPSATPPASRPPPLSLMSPAFEDGGILPDKYTQKAPQPSPSVPLRWTNAPAGTQSFVLIMHDMDVVSNRGMTDGLHWIAFNIPAGTNQLAEGVPNLAQLPDGTIQPDNRNTNGFVGPGFPGPTYHHYVIELLALDTKLDLSQKATREEIVAAMNGHIIGKAVLSARFHR
jgi:Raf kinase inhibitor-like YbhB/YbcL family protein